MNCSNKIMKNNNKRKKNYVQLNNRNKILKKCKYITKSYNLKSKSNKLLLMKQKKDNKIIQYCRQ